VALATQSQLSAITSADLAELSSKAWSGDKEAQYWLGLVYGQGRLVPKDIAASRGWLLKSAEQGYAPAQVAIGNTYLRDRRATAASDHGEAERWLRLAAMQDDAEGQFWLGVGYRQGQFGVTDHAEALNWFRKAAGQGHPYAQFCLGQMYEDGDGVPQSDVIAARWYRRAADHSPTWLGGVLDAASKLVELYDEDRLPRNDVEAYMWNAIVNSSSNPPTSEGIKKVSHGMSKAQIAEGQRRAEDWIKHHPFDARNLPHAGD
jgi:TPR repeat protein